MSVPTTTIYQIPGNRLQTLYSSIATLNNLPSNVVVSGSIFNTSNCSSNLFTAFVYLASGSAASLGTSGSVYYIDWSPDNVIWFGATATGYTGSIATLGKWNAIQFTGSAPFYRVLLQNLTGSSISGSVIVTGR